MPHQRKIVHCTLFFAVSLQNKLHFICPRSLPAHFRHPHRTPLHPSRAAFRSLLASVHPLARSCSTAASKTGRRFAPFSSRRPHHITANAHPSFRTPHLILPQTSCYLFRSLPTILLPAQSHCIHRPADRARSPSSPSVCFALPLQHTPTIAVSAPRFLRSSRQPSAVLGRPHSPA